MTAEWRLARAQAQAAWAEMDLATLDGTLPDNDEYAVAAAKLDRALEQIRSAEEMLVGESPATVRGAKSMLGMVLDILAAREAHPDHVLSKGPVLELVRGVHQALAAADQDTRLRPELRAVSPKGEQA